MERFELPNEHGWSWLHLAAFLVSRLSSPDGVACITAGHTGNKIHYEKHIPTLWEYGVSSRSCFCGYMYEGAGERQRPSPRSGGSGYCCTKLGLAYCKINAAEGVR